MKPISVRKEEEEEEDESTRNSMLPVIVTCKRLRPSSEVISKDKQTHTGLEVYEHTNKHT